MLPRFTVLLPTPVWESLPCSLCLVGLICLTALAGTSAALAQGESAFVQQVRIFDVDAVGELYPTGLAYSPAATALLVLEAAKAGQGSEIVSLTPREERAGTAALATAVADPINLAFDSKANRLLLLDAVNHELIEIKANADGTLALETLMRHQVQHWGLQNAQGMAV